MVHIPFDTRSVGYDDHIPHQQYGGGGGIGSEIIDSISSSSDDPLNNQHLQKKQQQQQQQQQYYFRGSAPYQRGYGRIQRGGGIGDVLRGLWRLLLPVVKRAGTTVGREVLSSGGRILDKLQQGENLKQATISEGKKSIDALLEKSGLPKQFGGGGGCIRNSSDTYRATTTTIIVIIITVYEDDKKSQTEESRYLWILLITSHSLI
uniref:Uncharacterized protein n=1 Tax=Globodera rostochiensis TaxID=31243 RepID=A0A914GRA3_GLORO